MIFFHLLNNSLFLFAPVGLKGNLSLLEICLFFSRGLNQMDLLARMLSRHVAVQVNGYWTWVVAGAAGGGAAGGAAGGGVASLPYDCHVGLVNWKRLGEAAG